MGPSCRAAVLIPLMVLAGCGGSAESSPDLDLLPSLGPGPKAYAVRLRERQVTGRVRNEYGLSSTATFTDATQLLLVDLENPATMPVVLDPTIWPLPKNLSYGTTLVDPMTSCWSRRRALLA